jgi:hypothetical protein
MLAKAGEGVFVVVPEGVVLWKARAFLARNLKRRAMDVEIEYLKGERVFLLWSGGGRSRAARERSRAADCPGRGEAW